MVVSKRIKFGAVCLIVELIFILIFAFGSDYDDTADPMAAPDPNPVVGYPQFQDVHVMIFIGFGFLMTFLRRYGYTAVGVNMFIAALVIQWAMVVRGMIYEGLLTGNRFPIGLGNMVSADFAAGTVLISFGAVLGKTSPLQLLIMAMLETLFAQINGWICSQKLGAVDIGESMFIHAFGAYFGLAVSFVLHNKKVDDSSKCESVYHSDIFSFIGTVFLWLYWPSFNGGGAAGDEQHRAFINTYLSLCACTIVSFAFSAFYDEKGRFNAVHIQNATLAGGVAVGTTANMPLGPFGAMMLGCVAGFISVTGYSYITEPMNKHLRIHDTCGVHNLHGLPALLAAVAGCIMALSSSADKWGRSYYEIFPNTVPEAGTAEYTTLLGTYWGLDPGMSWTSGTQAGRQILALMITLIMAIGAGIFTGFMMKIGVLDQVYEPDDLFEDELFWVVPEEPKLEPAALPPPINLPQTPTEPATPARDKERRAMKKKSKKRVEPENSPRQQPRLAEYPHDQPKTNENKRDQHRANNAANAVPQDQPNPAAPSQEQPRLSDPPQDYRSASFDTRSPTF